MENFPLKFGDDSTPSNTTVTTGSISVILQAHSVNLPHIAIMHTMFQSCDGCYALQRLIKLTIQENKHTTQSSIMIMGTNGSVHYDSSGSWARETVCTL